MKVGCPNKICSHYKKILFVQANGKYFRKNDSKWVKRYKCNSCGKRFSAATFSLAFGQNKRRINDKVFNLLASGVSLRRCAILLKVNRKTIHRKLIYLAAKARIDHQNFLKKIKLNKTEHMQFDDLITTEHTKLKPLSVSTAVDAKRRYILDAQVSSIPSFGHLAKISRAKYGYRENSHNLGLNKLMNNIKDLVSAKAIIRSDKHKAYPGVIKKYFPNSDYQTFEGGRSCVVGQGELKKLSNDPLWAINHTYAVLRANINRLIRKTWCTTKDPDRLKDHLDLFISWYNQIYLRKT
jgi:transposase-like protein